MKKIVAVMWNSYLPPLVEAVRSRNLFRLKAWASRRMEEEKNRQDFLKEAETADLILLYRTSEAFWEELATELSRRLPGKPVIWTGYEASFWPQSFGGAEVAATVYRYLLYGGKANFGHLVHYLASLLGIEARYEPPRPLPWEGIYHPHAKEVFTSVEDYWSWYQPPSEKPVVGLLFSRQYWVNGEIEVEEALIQALEEEGMAVLPVFAYSLEDKALGTQGGYGAVKKFFLKKDGTSRIEALIKMIPFFLGTKSRSLADTSAVERGVSLLKRLNVPVFQPLSLYYQDESQWRQNPQGLTHEIGWALAMPEFEGVIEPLALAVVKKEEDQVTGALLERRRPLPERIRRFARRIRRWVDLKRTPSRARRLVFVLHNNPCASVEATVGAAANLDALESVVRILNELKQAGYQVENPPKTGEELARLILDRKALSEFRWTTVEEIVKKGGALAFIPLEQYQKWWANFPETVRKRMEEAWGPPPGQAKNGLPAAMVYKGQIVVTGLRFGNVLVCVQPKRGCAGARCDGRVCKILHDPDVPPPHQYVATYRYFEEVFGAHAVIHVGTHGNLEFLPGKGTALSEACLPDLVLHELPHIYIYNADNPPEGTIAKRRSYAVLVDHMQTVMQEAGLYGPWEELALLLEEYEKARFGQPARAHALKHLILDTLKKHGLYEEFCPKGSDLPFEELLRRLHEHLERLAHTQIQDGLHVFGEIPKGSRLVAMVRSILRQELLERLETAKLWAQEEIWPDLLRGKFSFISSPDEELWLTLKQRVQDLKERLEASQERKALLKALSGGYIPPGPSGLITRGRDDVLPTGRNFYSLDPRKLPTKAAYRVGCRLAEALLEKYLQEHGSYPENVAIYWMANDIMWADGEGLAQIMALLGVEPEWQANGRVKGFRVLPLEELNRPRIDVTVRISGILRDNFPGCMALLDQAIRTVALLSEPPEKNFVRKHTLERLARLKGKTDGEKALRRATFRLFASKPGTYQAGVNLAVYASAWKNEDDLADIFVYWNGYAYGEEIFGEEAQVELADSLRTVAVTFNKVVTDEYDLLGCCSYFGTQGGLTLAARKFSGGAVPAYYGDTRNPAQIEVRTLSAEIDRVVRTKLLNPKWIEGMKRHGYRGAGEIAKRIGRVYGWQATTHEVSPRLLEDLARKYVLDQENRLFFEEHNPWALEEIVRRFLEAVARGLWQPSEEIHQALKEAYLRLESRLEELFPAGQAASFQGGMVDVLSPDEIPNWGKDIQELRKRLSEEGGF